MSRSPLRPASAPHTNKAPSACHYCGSRVITRKGVRKKKLEIVQLWRCGSCKRLFTPGPAALRNKTYPIRTVLQALTLYNLGYTLGETAKRLKSKAGRAVSPTTIATWIGAHKEQTTFRRLRAEAKTIYPPAQTIRSIKLYHRQVYAFAYHRSKLTLLRRNPQHQRFEALASFLETVPSSRPHELFRRDDDPKARASQAHPAFADINRLTIAKRTPRPRPRRSSFPPSAATSCGTRRCKILCSPMTRAPSRSRFPSGSPKTRSLTSKHATASSSRRVGRRVASPATSTFCKCATMPCTSSTTNPMRAPTSRLRSSRSMRWRSPIACRA